MKTDNTTFTLWRHPNSYYACIVILNATHPENLSCHFGSLGWMIHQSCTQPLLLLCHQHYQSWAGQQLVAAACSHEVSFHDMETILNLSFCWEGKLIELLCFHSLKYSLSLVLLDGLIQLFCSFSQEYKGFLLGSQTWDHPHHCRLQVRQEETGMLCILDPSAQKSFHWYNLWDSSVFLSHIVLEIS